MFVQWAFNNVRADVFLFLNDVKQRQARIQWPAHAHAPYPYPLMQFLHQLLEQHTRKPLTTPRFL